MNSCIWNCEQNDITENYDVYNEVYLEAIAAKKTMKIANQAYDFSQ